MLPTYKYVLALDPSGNYNEGKGTTGMCLFDTSLMKTTFITDLRAKDFNCIEGYWNGIIQLVLKFYTKARGNLCLIIEDYLLYSNRIDSQINSRLETPKLIGALQYTCYIKHIYYTLQLASEVKLRWEDSILKHKGYIEKRGKLYYLPQTNRILNVHCRDALRHAVHYATFKNQKGK
jgi:hypothetical protein